MRFSLSFLLLALPVIVQGATSTTPPPRGSGTATNLSAAALAQVTNIVSSAVTNVGTNFTVARHIFVATNGNDATALPERPDRPYLTVSNAVAALPSNWTLDIRPGNYSIPLIGQRSNAPLRLISKTNVTIRGPGARLNAAGIGSLWLVWDVTNIVMEGFTMRGVMTNNVLPEQSGMVWYAGAVDGVECRDLTLLDVPNHGFTATFESDVVPRLINQSYRRCRFVTGGTTNGLGALSADGAAIACITKNTLIEGCSFVNWLRCVEAYNVNRDFDQEWGDVRIVNNLADGIIETFVYQISTNAPRWVISGNVVKGYSTNDTEASAAARIGIYLYHAKDWVVEENVFIGVDNAISFNSASVAGIQGLLFTGNAMRDISSRAVNLARSAGSGLLRGVTLSHNSIIGCSDIGILSGLDQGLIVRNTLLDTGVDGSSASAIYHGDLGGFFAPVTNTVIEGNFIGNSGATAFTDGSITIDSGARRTRLRGNVLAPGITAIANSGVDTLGLAGANLEDFIGGSTTSGAVWTRTNATGEATWSTNLTNLGTVRGERVLAWAGKGASNAEPGGTVWASVTPVATAGLNPTNLHTFTVPGNTLTGATDRLVFRTDFMFSGSELTHRLGVTFGGQTGIVFVVPNALAGGHAIVDGVLWRTGNSGQYCTAAFTHYNASLPAEATRTWRTNTTLQLGTNNLFAVWADVNDAGANGAVTNLSTFVKWEP